MFIYLFFCSINVMEPLHFSSCVHSDEFLLLCDELNIHFDNIQYICCYLEIMNNSSKELLIEKQATLYSSSLQMLKEIIIKYMNCQVIPLDIKHFAIISSSQENIADNLLSISETLHKYYNVSLQGGIGTVVLDPIEIADSFQHARQAS